MRHWLDDDLPETHGGAYYCRLGPLRTGGRASGYFLSKCPLCPLESAFWGRIWEESGGVVRVGRVVEQGEEGVQIVFRRTEVGNR